MSSTAAASACAASRCLSPKSCIPSLTVADGGGFHNLCVTAFGSGRSLSHDVAMSETDELARLFDAFSVLDVGNRAQVVWWLSNCCPGKSRATPGGPGHGHCDGRPGDGGGG